MKIEEFIKKENYWLLSRWTSIEDFVEEEGKDIKDYEGFYQVSNFGRVKSLDRTIVGRWGATNRKGRILRYNVKKRGYVNIVLQRDVKSKTCRVHRLVAQAFLENNLGKSAVDHIDEDKQNNLKSNLRWVTNQENSELYYSKRESSSKYNGVSYDNRDNVWRARFYEGGKEVFIGSFDSEDSAKEARDFASTCGAAVARAKYIKLHRAESRARFKFSKGEQRWHVNYYLGSSKFKHIIYTKDKEFAIEVYEYAKINGVDKTRAKYVK
jgi:hypothetical protein